MIRAAITCPFGTGPGVSLNCLEKHAEKLLTGLNNEIESSMQDKTLKELSRMNNKIPYEEMY